MGLIIWCQILLKNSSENFHSDITHPKLVLKYVATKKSTVVIMSGPPLNFAKNIFCSLRTLSQLSNFE